LKSASILERVATLLLGALPWLVLAYAVMAYLRTGIDLPYFDDWRDFARSVDGHMALGYLFRPINGTLYPVGKLIDSVVLSALGGNTVAYQTLSMVAVLGALLLLQWKLLRAVTDDRLLAASAFVLTLLMLQAGSYWGVQYLAYHQALPLVCFLLVLYVWLCLSWASPAKMLTTFLIGLVGGFSYVSGAIPGIAGAAILLLIGLARPHRRDLLQAGTAVGAASLISSLAQVHAIVVVQGPAALHPDAPLASPLTLDFWVYALGKVARSLALPGTFPLWSFVVAVLALFAVIAVSIGALLALVRRTPMTTARENQLVVTLFLAVVIGIYLCMVSAVRSNLRFPTIVTSLDLFIFAFGRFHFFWLTVLWPWLFLLLAQASPSRRVLAPAVAGIVAIALLLAGRLDHVEAFAGSQSLKAAALECIRDQLVTADTIACPAAVKGNLARHYANAVEVDASFLRAAPPTLRRFNPSPVFSVMTGLNESNATLNHALDIRWQNQSLTFRSAGDPQIVFHTGKPERLSGCLLLHIRATIDAARPEMAQLFYLPLDGDSFSAAHQVSAPVGADRAVEFVVKNASGFRDSLRLDPIAGAGQVGVSDVSVRCLVDRFPL